MEQRKRIYHQIYDALGFLQIKYWLNSIKAKGQTEINYTLVSSKLRRSLFFFFINLKDLYIGWNI